MQSPIDLSHQRVQIVHKFVDSKIAYNPTNATLMNRGHDIMVCTKYCLLNSKFYPHNLKERKEKLEFSLL